MNHIIVEKMMSLSPTEYVTTLRVLAPEAVIDDAGSTIVPLPGGSVQVLLSPRPAITLGGLLVLPQAIVSLEFCNVAEADRIAFLAYFDRTFHRGGG
jgi:hypothetical protein